MAELKLVNGRPEQDGDRLEKEIRTYDFLDELGIEYQRVDHRALMTMEDAMEADEVLGATICKNLFLCNQQKTSFYLLMLPGEKRFQTKVVSKKLGVSRLSFAGETYMEQLLNLMPGSVSVMGLLNDTKNRVQLVIDKEILTGEYIGCHPCINTASIRFRTKDFMEKILPAMHHEPIVIEWTEE